jgi:hypothetical protein
MQVCLRGFAAKGQRSSRARPLVGVTGPLKLATHYFSSYNTLNFFHVFTNIVFSDGEG